MWMKSSVDPDRLASSEASFSRWTLFPIEASGIEFCKLLCLQCSYMYYVEYGILF